MTLSGDEARVIVCMDHEDWIELSDTKEIYDVSRWSIHYSQVFKHVPTNTFYKFDWREGATEIQDESPYEYVNTYTPIEVVEKEVTIKQWVIKE